MILTCPQCETRFLLPATRLGEGGRHVKCSNCSEVWHQEPDLDELNELLEMEAEDAAAALEEESELDTEQQTEEEATASEDDSDDTGVEELQTPAIDDIPDGVKPDHDGISVPALQDEGVNPKHKVIGGLAAAALVFLITFVGLYLSHQSVMSSWPASRTFYEIVGLDMPTPGEGLVFDRLIAKVEGHGDMEKVSLQGHVLNLTSHDQAVPAIEASLKDSHDKVLAHWIIEGTQKTLTAEGDFSFSTEHKVKRDQSQNVHLRFVLGTKKVTEASGEEEYSSEHAESSHDEHGKKPADSHAPADTHGSGHH